MDIRNMILDKTYEENGQKKIKCQDALEIAEKLDKSPHDIARVINKEKIKIAACQLGCFK